MVSVLASSAVDRGFEYLSGQTKGYKIGMLTARSIKDSCGTIALYGPFLVRQTKDHKGLRFRSYIKKKEQWLIGLESG